MSRLSFFHTTAIFNSHAMQGTHLNRSAAKKGIPRPSQKADFLVATPYWKGVGGGLRQDNKDEFDEAARMIWGQ